MIGNGSFATYLEIEKSISGVQSSGRTDGGTTSNMFSQLLTWMQESTAKKYIVATCNDIGAILNISQGAFLRRFDTCWFVDLPSDNERKEILKIMNKRYGTKISLETTTKMPNWTGAEIEKFVIDSVYDGVKEALEGTKPIYLQNKSVIEEARKWALNNARFANETKPVIKAGKIGRKLDLS